MKYLLKNEQIAEWNESGKTDFPKYTSQLMNWANQNAQGTRPAVVGQMSELFWKFVAETETVTTEKWKEWYLKHYPDACDRAAEKIFSQIENLQKAILLIDKPMVKRWVEDLVIAKTYNGLYVQKAILASLAEKTGAKYRLAIPEEEAKGIDGFVGDVAYSVKPDTYKTMNRLPEQIDVKMIYYTKVKNGLRIQVED